MVTVSLTFSCVVCWGEGERGGGEKEQNCMTSIILAQEYYLRTAFENVCGLAYETSSSNAMFITAVCVIFLA